MTMTVRRQRVELTRAAVSTGAIAKHEPVNFPTDHDLAPHISSHDELQLRLRPLPGIGKIKLLKAELAPISSRGGFALGQMQKSQGEVLASVLRQQQTRTLARQRAWAIEMLLLATIDRPVTRVYRRLCKH